MLWVLKRTISMGTQMNRLIDGSFEHTNHMLKIMDKAKKKMCVSGYMKF